MTTTTTTTTTPHASRRAAYSETIASGMSIFFMLAVVFFCVFSKTLTVSGLQYVSDWWSVPSIVYIAVQVVPLLHPERYHSKDDVWDLVTSPLAAGVIVLALPVAWFVSNLLGSSGWWWPQYYVWKIWVPSALAALVDFGILIATWRVAKSHAHP